MPLRLALTESLTAVENGFPFGPQHAPVGTLGLFVRGHHQLEIGRRVIGPNIDSVGPELGIGQRLVGRPNRARLRIGINRPDANGVGVTRATLEHRHRCVFKRRDQPQYEERDAAAWSRTGRHSSAFKRTTVVLRLRSSRADETTSATSVKPFNTDSPSAQVCRPRPADWRTNPSRRLPRRPLQSLAAAAVDLLDTHAVTPTSRKRNYCSRCLSHSSRSGANNSLRNRGSSKW